jgi:hypothetical protein
MGKGKRTRRERDEGRRKSMSDRRDKEPTTVEQWRTQNRKFFREAKDSGFVGVEGLEGLEIPELGSTRSMFKPAPTSEPGTMFECEDCQWQGYLEGLFSTGSSPNGIAASESVMFGLCPECQGNMYAIDHIILNGPEGGISATHPAGLQFALQILLGKLESGEITPDEAVEELRKEPILRRIVDRLEAYPATTAIVSTTITAILTVLGTQALQDDREPTLTPDQVEQIVKRVVTAVNEQDGDEDQDRPVRHEGHPSTAADVSGSDPDEPGE